MDSLDGMVPFVLNRITSEYAGYGIAGDDLK